MNDCGNRLLKEHSDLGSRGTDDHVKRFAAEPDLPSTYRHVSSPLEGMLILLYESREWVGTDR